MRSNMLEARDVERLSRKASDDNDRYGADKKIF